MFVIELILELAPIAADFKSGSIKYIFLLQGPFWSYFWNNLLYSDDFHSTCFIQKCPFLVHFGAVNVSY